MKQPPQLSRRLVLGALTASSLWLVRAAHGASDEKYPDIVSVNVRASGTNTFDFDVTVSSPYDTPRRYADGFRVTTTEGVVLGERKLFHDHQGEQPFTRDLYGVQIPSNVRSVTVQGRDQKSGYGGKSVQVKLPGRQ
jgi:hypothetical protein